MEKDRHIKKKKTNKKKLSDEKLFNFFLHFGDVFFLPLFL
jgi:hypothetical protein